MRRSIEVAIIVLSVIGTGAAVESRVEGRLDRMGGRLDRMDGRLDRMDGRLDRIEGRIHNLEDGQADLRERMRALEVLSERFVLAHEALTGATPALGPPGEVVEQPAPGVGG